MLLYWWPLLLPVSSFLPAHFKLPGHNVHNIMIKSIFLTNLPVSNKKCYFIYYSVLKKEIFPYSLRNSKTTLQVFWSNARILLVASYHYCVFSVLKSYILPKSRITPEAHLEQSQTSNTDLFENMVTGFQSFIIFEKISILDFWLGSDYASVLT